MLPQPTEHTLEELLGPLNAVEEEHAPSRLFLAGEIRLLQHGPRVSVVGSREASPQGRSRAAILSRELVRHGITVASGLARGIDTVAHETALREGGRTIAILGTPLDQCSPVENRQLQELIMREHLAVSQFAAGTTVHASNFPLRNRTMALLSDATVIVEAGARSGTEHQAWEALRLGRLLFVMQSLTGTDGPAWIQKVLAYGAQVLTRENLDLVLDNLAERERGGTSATF